MMLTHPVALAALATVWSRKWWTPTASPLNLFISTPAREVIPDCVAPLTVDGLRQAAWRDLDKMPAYLAVTSNIPRGQCEHFVRMAYRLGNWRDFGVAYANHDINIR